MPEVNIDRVTRRNRNVAGIKKHREKGGGSEGEMYYMLCVVLCGVLGSFEGFGRDK